MATENITVVKKGNRISVHSSFKKACEAYGWNYDGFGKRFQEEVDGHKIRKIPMGVTINCFILVDFCASHKSSQIVSKMDSSTYEVTFSTMDEEYRIEVLTSEEYEPENIIDGQVESGGYYWDNPTEVLKVEKITDDGPIEVKIDKWTENELLNLVDLNS